ncbi:class I SAM-dependent methyltransferase [Christiangramia salexigens]|uniref:SAM-dependent methyltransferase n=1 Tax=Christiangramia salexigens TaxID=1913577 RepID=A0A1L3J3G3_9FLAO|nr:class I SAM-dependent methyltransferase [Christiangramia salexigens]APG59650.1 SAM-dependent methyltransferase [Christiangramia salexigens]
MKDNFSHNSGNYALYRPGYPNETFEYIKSQLSGFENAWDCGTGNGQVARELSEFFRKVEATDISKNQLENAEKRPNIRYSLQPAEATNFPDSVFDLIISAQAVHWFDFDKFYAEVKRCLKPDGLLVLLGYSLFSSNTSTNNIIYDFYTNIIGPYWDPERKYLDNAYHSIPFPFKEIEPPEFSIEYQWEIEHLLGYLRTWSAVKHYKEANDKDPVSFIEPELRETFGAQNKVRFPILIRLGKL